MSKLPLYAFKNDSSPKISSGVDELPSDFFLNTLLLGQVSRATKKFSFFFPLFWYLYETVIGISQWEDRMSRGLFRYDVTACETKVIPGKCGFVAQLNEGRHLKKRPTEFRVDRVLQPFDPAKFNFTKVGQEEVLFRFEAGEDHKSLFLEHAVADETKSPSVVAINVIVQFAVLLSSFYPHIFSPLLIHLTELPLYR